MATLRNLKKLLENGFEWPRELSVNKSFRRLHDDHDGQCVGTLMVGFSKDGDAWVEIDNPRNVALRFRSAFGGSHSPRVHNALILLALAIKLDSEERPDPVPTFPRT